MLTPSFLRPLSSRFTKVGGRPAFGVDFSVLCPREGNEVVGAVVHGVAVDMVHMLRTLQSPAIGTFPNHSMLQDITCPGIGLGCVGMVRLVNIPVVPVHYPGSVAEHFVFVAVRRARPGGVEQASFGIPRVTRREGFSKPSTAPARASLATRSNSVAAAKSDAKPGMLNAQVMVLHVDRRSAPGPAFSRKEGLPAPAGAYLFHHSHPHHLVASV